jgi:hypothetical protein
MKVIKKRDTGRSLREQHRVNGTFGPIEGHDCVSGLDVLLQVGGDLLDVVERQVEGAPERAEAPGPRDTQEEKGKSERRWSA